MDHTVDISEINKIIRHDNLESLSQLIDQSPELINQHLGDNRGQQSLLIKAISTNDFDKVKLIIERGADLTNEPEHLICQLMATSSSGKLGIEVNIEILKLLISHGMSFPESKHDCLSFIQVGLRAIYRIDNVKYFKLLINLGFDPVKTEKIAQSSIIVDAMLNCSSQKPRIADYLLDIGCTFENLGGYYRQPIEVAIQAYMFGFAEKLVSKGANADTSKQWLLHNIAYVHNDIPRKFLDFIIDEPGDFNRINSYGETPLHLAACENNINYITYLLDKGADINAKNNLGNTPLIDAAKQKNKESISLLISLGADLNLINNQGKTALDVALSLPGFKRVWTTMVKVGAKTTAELSSCIVSTDSPSLLVENTKNNIESGEQWADQFRGYISTLSVEQVSPWQSLIRQQFPPK